MWIRKILVGDMSDINENGAKFDVKNGSRGLDLQGHSLFAQDSWDVRIFKLGMDWFRASLQ